MTDKQYAFLVAYLGPARLNATKAARLAGYVDAEKDGWRVRQKPQIRQAIEEGLARLVASGGSASDLHRERR